LTPLVFGGLTAAMAELLRFGWEASCFIGLGAALFSTFVFRTTWGRGLEEHFDEALSRAWRLVSVNFALGLLTLIVQFFQQALELIEKGIYPVDEWLRFHEGETWVTLAFKLVFGTLWFFVSYVFKFAWNLLIEPQINPIKHFPVVTVSHKLLLPLIPSLANTFGLSAATMGTIVFGIPGIFGFLVWECKENWKLYRANRKSVIGPVPVGSHGEYVRGLLRPGLHSGVIPKTYAKWRRAESARNHAKAAKLRHNLEHIAEAVHDLAERVLVAYLDASRRWNGLAIRVESIHLATNRLRILLAIADWGSTLIISIEERGGWLIGSIEQPGWLDRLNDEQRAAFADIVTALYKLAGVHVLREQAASVLQIEPYRLDCRPEGLVILKAVDSGQWAVGSQKDAGVDEVTIDYGDLPTMTASAPIDGRVMPAVNVAELVLSENDVNWDRWVERWKQDQAEKGPFEPILTDYRVLPMVR
jgi:hypothetical protein